MSDDLDLYLQQDPKEYETVRQERFEHKALLKLLRGLETTPGLASKLAKAVGPRFTTLWFDQNYSEFPLRLTAYKAKKTVPLYALLKAPHKLPLYDEWDEHKANYGSGEPVGLMFASDGDGLPEMILHSCTHWHKADDHWRILMPGTQFNGLALETIDGFIASFKIHCAWRLKWDDRCLELFPELKPEEDI